MLVGHLVRQGVAVTWHPIVGTVGFPAAWRREWIRPLQVDVPEGVDPFCWKLRAFVESGRIVDGERYGVLCDDDLYGDGVLAAVAGMGEPIVVVSMLRGHCVPVHSVGFSHPISTLTASSEMMIVGAVGLQQCFVMGEILRQTEIRPEDAPFCDGQTAAWLAEEFGGDIRYEPGLSVLFNRLEPGRWAVDEDEVERWR